MVETVTVDGVELNVDDLETALENVYEMVDSDPDEYIDFVSGYTVVGDVIITSDGFRDNDVFISTLEDATSIGESSLDSDNKGFTSISRLEEEVERMSKDPFEDYVLDIEGVMSNANSIEVEGTGYAIVSDTSNFKDEEITALVEDDAVEMYEFRVRDASTAVINVNDVRDE